MNIHSFKFKLMSSITAIVFTAIMILSTISILITYFTINQEINEKMPLKLDSISQQVDIKLDAHSSIVRSLASLSTSCGNTISRALYIDMLRELKMDNPQSFGFGLWFEPYKYSPAQRYFGPYVYKSGDKLVETAEYETTEYDYPTQQWYITGKNVTEANRVVWTPPYFDEVSGITMSSAVAPFFDKNSKVLGVITGDYDLVEIQDTIANIRDEKIGLRAFLLANDGTFMSFQDKKLVMKTKIDQYPEKEFAELGRVILRNKNGVASINFAGESTRIFYREIKQTGWILCIAVSESKLYTPLTRMIWATVIAMLAAITLSVFVSMIISGRISNPVKLMSQFSARLAVGDFTERISINQTDEIGALARDLNSSADNLEALISNIMLSAQNLSQAVSEITKGNFNLSQRTSEQASALEEIASTIEENTATVEKNADNAKQAQNLTAEGVKKSSLQNEQAVNVITSINEINESSKKISEIISVINEIAFQTNLLALNAAVEAARAGEQGRGFAVVASEVRNLAQRSGSAAKEIEELIKESVARVEKGTELVVKSNEFVKEISAAAAATAQLIAEIAAASSEQRTGMEQINQAIMDLDSMTQQNAALVEQTASASEEMSSQAQEMLALMRKFTIRESALSGAVSAGEKTGPSQAGQLHHIEIKSLKNLKTGKTAKTDSSAKAVTAEKPAAVPDAGEEKKVKEIEERLINKEGFEKF